VLGVDKLGCLSERWDASLSPPLGHGIAALTGHFAVGQRPFARFGEGDQRKPSKTDIAPFAANNRAEDPALGSRGLNDKIETIPVGISAWLAQLPNADRRKSFVWVPPCPLQFTPHNPAHKPYRIV
jgi:hypothetical protein